jgi:hypothetical protein
MTDWQIPNEFELPKNHQWRGLDGAPVDVQRMDPPGPIGEGYMYGLDPIDLIMGPVGSGKTTCSVFRSIAIPLRMPVCKDGVIRARGAIMHVNGRVLQRTFLPSLFRYFPRDLPGFTFEGGQDRPFVFTMRFVTPKGTKLQITLDGFGIGDHNIDELLRGYECNFGLLVEADQMSRGVPPSVYARCKQGRYPGRALLADEKAQIPSSVFGDLNPPNITSWIHEDFVEKPRKGYTLRRQPSGLSERAENRRYVSREDYQAMADTLDPDRVRRFVHGEFGIVSDGALVYPDFDHSIHVAKNELQPLDLPLIIGADGGGSPALIIAQYTPKGHMRWLDEVTTDPGTGVGRFAEYVIDRLQAKYRGLPIARGWGDPSAFHGADRVAGELSFMEILGQALNIRMMPTVTNDPVARQESVSYFLRRRTDPQGFPYFIMSPHMKATLGGFQGGFIIHLNPNDDAARIRFVKNKFSHPHEAGQYVCYGARGHVGMINDAARAGRGGNIINIASGKRPQNAMDMNLD